MARTGRVMGHRYRQFVAAKRRAFEEEVDAE